MNYSYIQSTKNSYVKFVKSLKIKKNRDANKLFLIEGIRIVEDAFTKSNCKIDSLIVSKSFFQKGKSSLFFNHTKSLNIKKYVFEDSVFDTVSETVNSQGIIALVNFFEYDFIKNLSNNNFFIYLDSISDPGNLGTIIRTSEAAGTDGVILSEGCVDVYSPKVIRATMGSIFRVPVYKNIENWNMLLKNNGFKIISSSLDAKIEYYKADYKEKICIVIGSEAHGISKDIINYSDLLIKIPMEGQVESLNAAIASSVILYEAYRQRKF